MKAITLLSIVLAQSAFASRSYVRLDDPGFTMEHVAVHNQRQIGDCYAHAAAQIYDAWRFYLGDKDYSRQSSGLEINQRYKTDIHDSDPDGGHLKSVMPTLSTDGTCAQSDMNEDLFKPGMSYDVDQYATDIMAIYNKYQKQLRSDLGPENWYDRFTPSGPKETKLRQKYQGLAVADATELNARVLKHPYNNSLFGKIQPTKDSQRNVVKIFKILGLIQCDDGFKMKAVKPYHVDQINKIRIGFDPVNTPVGTTGKMVDRDHSDEILEKIHNELDYEREAMPIGISYCSTVLEAGRNYPYLVPHKEKDGSEADLCGRHASLIIGRRTKEVTLKEAQFDPSQWGWKPGQDPKKQQNPLNNPYPTKTIEKKVVKSQFLIRNTWGNTCYPYSKDWECDWAKGSVWVDEDVLIQAINQIQVMDRG